MAIINYEREYQISTGKLGIKITYSNESVINTLSCDVIKDIELNYGYEDQDDILYYYPNTVKLIFDDYDKKNYNILKHSLDRFTKIDNPIYNRPLFGGIEIYLNSNLKFKGFIDPLTLVYHDSSRTLEFEGVCLSSLLKDYTLSRSIHYIDNHGTLNEYQVVECTRLLYGIFKQIWPDFPWFNLYHYLNEIEYGSYGIFVQHDWKFKGELSNVVPNIYYSDWSNVQSFIDTRFHFDSMNFFGEDRLAQNCQDVIRQIALEFGAIIGVEDYGKIYFIKRFGADKFNAQELKDTLIKFDIFTHLDSISGVIVNNHWNGKWTFEIGNIRRNDNGEILNPQDVLTYDTNIGTYQHENISGTCVYILNPTNNSLYPVSNGVNDPQIDNDYEFIENRIGKWILSNRSKVKQRVECELYGIDYRMAYLYKLKYDNENYIYFRPMTITKNLMKYSTKLTGIEI